MVLNGKNCEILQQALSLYIENQEECAVCIDDLKAPVITHCKHVFCSGCIRKVIQTQGKCPLCRTALSEEHLLEPPPEASAEGDTELDLETQSSKTEAVLKILQATLKNDGSKVIIFSQWYVAWAAGCPSPLLSSLKPRANIYNATWQQLMKRETGRNF